MTTLHNGGQNDTWAKIAAQYGFAAALCAGVLYFVGFQMVLPMQATHTKLIEAVSATNQQNADTNRQNAETLRAQTVILQRIDTRIEADAKARSEDR